MSEPGTIAVTIGVQSDEVPPDSDIKALRFDHYVSVTPLSIDLTSRVDLQTFAERFVA
jgi:5'-nucleotidase